MVGVVLLPPPSEVTLITSPSLTHTLRFAPLQFAEAMSPAAEPEVSCCHVSKVIAVVPMKAVKEIGG